MDETPFESNRIPLTLFGIYITLFILLAIKPFDRAVWWAENIPVVIVVAILVLLFSRFRFSNTSYVLMAVFIFLHTVGGHFTFERVPFGAVTEFFGFERNHYDRLAHFSVGFYAYPIAEVLLVYRLVHSRWLVALFPVFSIVTVAGFYEIIEWQYAMNADPSAGIAVLGSQGDVWDAQKDILADTLGALLVIVMFFFQHRKGMKSLAGH